MCPMFIYKSAPNVFGISQSKARPRLPNLAEEWCLQEGLRGQTRKCSEGGSDEELLLEIMKNIDNEMFFQIMEFLEAEGYTVSLPNNSKNSSDER